ncbi:Homeobox-leucine zipper protein HDG1, partial [Cucurbita argyrosperma subsp. argyrosperma]
MNLETDAELPQAEESIPEVTMEQKPNEGPSDSMKDDLEVSPKSLTESTMQDSSIGEIFYNDEPDFLEMQRVNNIIKAAYKEFMAIAMRANALIFHPPAVGSVEDLQEMFHTTPPRGYTVECSVEYDVLSITPESLITIMMNGVIWSSIFSNIICDGSFENVLTPLKEFWSADSNSNSKDVVLVNAQLRLPAEFLPRWCTRFLRFKMDVAEDTWAICDVSTDYFMETASDSTVGTQYRRRPSGVVIRQFGVLSEVLWVENAEVQEIDIPNNISSKVTSNFHLTAKQWISILSQNLKLNPFPLERKWDLYCDDNIRILRDMKASNIGYNHDYVASSTVYIPETPIRLLMFLATYNVTYQLTSIKSPEQLKLVAALYSEDNSYTIGLRRKVEETVADELFADHEFFLQEATANDYCSLVLSSQLSEEDVHISLMPKFSMNSVFLRPSGFAIMPAEQGGLQSKASLVTIFIRRELQYIEDDHAIAVMRSHMSDVIDQMTNIQSPNATAEDSKQKTPKK